MSIERIRLWAVATVCFALIAASCTDSSPLAPSGGAPAADLVGVSSGGVLGTPAGATFLECVTGVPGSASFTADALGASYSAAGVSISIPANAVLTPTTFTVTVPATGYRGVQVTAAGSEHFVFALPISVTVSYGHCPGSGSISKSLRAFYVDDRTGAVLEDLGGIDNKLTRSLTFSTDHFSTYYLGTN